MVTLPQEVPFGDQQTQPTAMYPDSRLGTLVAFTWRQLADLGSNVPLLGLKSLLCGLNTQGQGTFGIMVCDSGQDIQLLWPHNWALGPQMVVSRAHDSFLVQ